MSETLGNNARERLGSIARQITGNLDEIAEAQDQIKQLKAEAKAEGYDLKALGQIIKELRKGPKFQAAQLELELVLDTYRDAVRLPRDLETAQAAAKSAAETAQPPQPPSGAE